MFSKKNWYLVHRWLGLITGVQLLAWSAGGFTFSILHIKNVRGDFDKREWVEPPLDLDRVRLSPKQAVDRVAEQGIVPTALATVTLRQRGRRIAYELFNEDAAPFASVDATTGEVRLRISETEAVDVALSDFAHEATVASVELLEGEPPLEFRGGRMPVYQVILDHAKHPHLYICPVTGNKGVRLLYGHRTRSLRPTAYIHSHGQLTAPPRPGRRRRRLRRFPAERRLEREA